MQWLKHFQGKDSRYELIVCRVWFNIERTNLDEDPRMVVAYSTKFEFVEAMWCYFQQVGCFGLLGF